MIFFRCALALSLPLTNGVRQWMPALAALHILLWVELFPRGRGREGLVGARGGRWRGGIFADLIDA